MKLMLKTGLLLVGLLLLSACGGGGSSAPANVSPVANAGTDQSVNEQTTVTLTGSASDSDGSVATANWSQVSGTTVTLTSVSSATIPAPVTFTAPAVAVGTETLVFRLSVTDDKGASTSDQVTVTVNTTNVAPVVNAGADFAADEQSSVTLMGNATDDGTIASYQWSQSSGTSVTLNNANTATASFNAPSLSVAETLVFSLMATDDRGTSSSDTVSVTINPVMGLNSAPVANAGADQMVVSAAKVNLDGSGSSDPDGSIVSYAWSQTTGTAVTLSGANTSAPGFDAPTVVANQILTFQLTVTDNEGATNVDLINVTVTPTPTQVTLSGKMTYDFVPFGASSTGLDYAHISQVGIPWATVEAIVNNVTVANTTTDELGNYSIVVDPNVMVSLRVSAEMKKTGTPSWDVKVVDNTNKSALYTMSGAAFNSGVSNQSIDMNAPSGWGGTSYTGTRVAAPFSILHSIYLAMNKVLQANANHIFTPLNLNWSVNNVASGKNISLGQIGTSFYSQDNIYILGDADSDTDEYDEHVLIHEWGHDFEDNFSRSDSIGGSHGGGDRLDMRVALGEGWGNAWSGIATDDPLYRDSNGTAQAQDFVINVELNGVANPGWYSEGSAQSIIYDLYDANSDGVDKVSLGFTPIYNVLINQEKNTPALTSIFSLVKAIKDTNPSAISDIDALLSKQNIVVNDEWGTGESNDAMATNAIDVLPVYKGINPDGVAVQVCSNPEFTSSQGSSNKLGVYQFLKFTIASAGNYQIQLSSGTNPVTDPDFYLFKNGPIGNALSGANGTESKTFALSPGVHVLTVDDDKVARGDLVMRSCINVSITKI